MNIREYLEQGYRLDEEINCKIEQLDVLNALVEDKDQRLILELRYLCMATWPEIAAKLNYSSRRIQQIHKDALKKYR